MKNLILLAAVFLSINVFAAEKNPTVNEKVLKTFNHVFKDAQNVTWSNSDKYAEASFKTGEIKIKATLNNNGTLVQTIRYYKESGLPVTVLSKVKNEYLRQEIWGVVEVSNSNGTGYVITLKDNKNWYHVNVDRDDNIYLIKKYKRGDI